MAENMQIVDRLLTIIEQLCLAEKPLGPTAVAERTGLNKSTVYRLLAALTTHGYAERTPEGEYRLGYKLINLVGCYINSLELIAEARPFLARLTQELQLTAHLGVLDKAEVIYVEKLDTLPGGRLDSQIGFRVPAYCSSLGKCLMAGLSGEQLDEVLSVTRFNHYTVNTIPGPRELRTHLRQVRSQGWAMDNGEYEPDHRCIAAPIYDYRGELVAAISASGSTLRLTDDYLPTVIKSVQGTAAELSRRLGYGE